MQTILRALLSFIVLITTTQIQAQTANTQDSLALVDFYNANQSFTIAGNIFFTNWSNHANWRTVAPLSTWYGVTVDANGRVIALNLNGNAPIVGVFPASFANLSQLKDLEIAPIGVSTITGALPDVLGSLTELTVLNFHGNYFTGKIPTSYAPLTKLHRLDLGGANSMSQGAFSSVVTSLTALDSLDLDSTGITGALPNTLGNLTQLKYLNLAKNRLSSSIPASLGNCTGLQTFLVNNNNLNGTFPASFLALPNIGNDAMNFNFSGNRFSFDAFEQLVGSPTIQMASADQQRFHIIAYDNKVDGGMGSTLSRDTFFLYNHDRLVKTQFGDSSFVITSSGWYSFRVRNALCSYRNTLYTDTAYISVSLPAGTVNTTQAITGTDPVDINIGLTRLATIAPAATPNGLSGNTTVAVNSDASVQLYHQQPYVQRHYDIQPAANASTAEATVTLFFTQADFDNFNNYVTSNNLSIPLLPTNGHDNGNVRIIQQHGTFSGSSDPGNYSGASVIITPTVVFDYESQWWAVSFPVTGFSGFFVSTVNMALPLTLLDFSGKATAKGNSLSWNTTAETGTRSFIIESKLNNGFIAIGTVAAASTSGEHNYSFNDANAIAGVNQYRLKMLDIDGQFTYSKTITVQGVNQSANIILLPNPVSTTAVVQVNSNNNSSYSLVVTDNAGKTIRQISGQLSVGINRINMDMAALSRGVYMMALVNGSDKTVQHLKMVKE